MTGNRENEQSKRSGACQFNIRGNHFKKNKIGLLQKPLFSFTGATINLG